jgi:hypothetical protein
MEVERGGVWCAEGLLVEKRRELGVLMWFNNTCLSHPPVWNYSPSFESLLTSFSLPTSICPSHSAVRSNISYRNRTES